MADASKDSASASGASQPLAPALSSLSNSVHLKQKRARSQLSCTPCRVGKLKCNREKPACDQCQKRNKESSCVFLPPPAKHKQAQNVKGRIRQLETLVVDLMNQNRNAHSNDGKGSITTEGSGDPRRFEQPTPPSDNDAGPQSTNKAQRNGKSPSDDVDAATTPFGRMRISKDEVSYVGEAHWGAILSSISDLKRDLGDEDDEPSEKVNEPSLNEGGIHMGSVPPDASGGVGFMLGGHMTTKEQLIAAVPEKRIADRLLSAWFNSPDPFKPVIHAPTFQEEYRRFWRSPSETPVMWLGLLFAILSLAASFGLRDTDPGTPHSQATLELVKRYHTLAASATVLSDFTRPREYTLECLIMYAAGLHGNSAFLDVWLTFGLIVRLALRMGYHRDPKHSPKIDPFHSEMRRRVWAIINMIDVLISFQLGLPSMVRTIQCDVDPPQNLLDRDFDRSTLVMPPGRGSDELTPCSYTRAKLQITRVFADAAELSHTTIAPSYDELMALDRRLEEAKAAIPPLLQMPDISELVTDLAEQLMCRFNLDLLYLKSKTVLHRRYMLTPRSQLTAEEQQNGIGRSRNICVECALRVLQHHHTIYAATQPGGQLESVKWYMGSISTHDFLLAAMIICLELSFQIRDVDSHASPGGTQYPRRKAMMEALENSQRIWSEAKGTRFSQETEKASRAMAAMLERVRDQFPAQAPKPTGQQDLDAQVSEAQRPGNLGVSHSEALEDAQSRASFQGILPRYDWGDIAGVSSISADGRLAPTNSLAQISVSELPLAFPDQSSIGTSAGSGNTPFQQSYTQQMDFSMIGDLFEDVNNGNVDWQMLDNHINNAFGAEQRPYSEQFQGAGLSSAVFPSPDNDIATNGAYLGEQRRTPADIDGSQPPTFLTGNLDYDANALLEDVQLDLAGTDINREGKYPFAMDNWLDFYKS